LASFDAPAPCYYRPDTAAASASASGSTVAHHGGVGAGVESQDASESASKVRVEDGVDERIKETIDVAQPCDEADDRRRDGSATERAAERSDGGDCEEWQPTDDERAGDDRQSPCRLPLSPTASSTLPVATQLRRVTPWRRTTPGQNIEKILSVAKHESLMAEFCAY